LFDLEPWLSPLGEQNPSGASLRNHRLFHDLERLMEPRIEVMRDEMNNPVSHNELPVDWSQILDRAEELRTQGRDLRLLIVVARCLTNIAGFGGLRDGLRLIAHNLEDYWDTIHPELRPGVAPKEAALRRINTLLQLQNDHEGLLADLRQRTFFAPRGVGPITGRDLERGTLDRHAMLAEAPGGLSESEKAALCRDHDALINRVRVGCAAQAEQAGTVLESVLSEVREAATALAHLESVLSARLEGRDGRLLRELGRFLERVEASLSRRDAEATAGATAAAPAVASDGEAAADGAARTSPAGFPDRLASRDEVIRCLDLIVDFYERTEPASPIPHLARRVRRMVPMDFLELMEELAPAGLKEFRALAGVTDSRKPAQKDRGDSP
jgi:type VI secretion system protein ImpA